MPRRAARLVLLLAFIGLAGCATVEGPPQRQSAGQKLDPWENWNRKVFSFNEGLDEHVLKPVATAYQKVVPSFIRTAIHNFFSNAEDGWSAVNHLLQGKGQSGFEMLVRFNTNTVLGFGGLLDIASEAGLERQPEDFGQTLGRWGFGAGAYIVWPVLGPSSVRDSLALPLDRSATPAVVFKDYADELGILSVQLVDTRANLLGASRVIDDIALDKYSFVRDGYLARRRSLVYDGSPPEREAVDDADRDAPAHAEAASAASAPASAASR
ncbi:MlaA family lipoprotein [Ideonella sp. BN130291]|uniref:MlaA family lipoprotein n=1 Tax=Ideonella sp. BN130291 TaxID=3112940 RepID=UPI002E253D67|nr:VacJ family lipoprotein [Ideonella sp. BN130291]